MIEGVIGGACVAGAQMFGALLSNRTQRQQAVTPPYETLLKQMDGLNSRVVILENQQHNDRMWIMMVISRVHATPGTNIKLLKPYPEWLDNNMDSIEEEETIV